MRVVANDGNAAELILDLPQSDNRQPARSISGNPIINDPFAEPTRHWHFSGLVPESARAGVRPGILRLRQMASSRLPTRSSGSR